MQKKVLTMVIACLLGLSINTQAQTSATPAATATPPATQNVEVPKTTIEFNVTEYDFGTIQQNDKVERIFTIKNTGKNPLIISGAKGSCGCTVPEYSKEPIAAGATSDIKVVFNSAGKSGNQTKTVTLSTNTDPEKSVLTLKGIVNVPKADENPINVNMPDTKVPPTSSTHVVQTPPPPKAAPMAKVSPEEQLKLDQVVIAKYLADKKVKKVKTTASGLHYKITKKGKGAKPTADNTVKVHYRGTLVDGKEFDSSYARKEPIEFPLKNVIPGWTEGLQYMNKGSKATFYIPSTLAYGAKSVSGIPSNSVLVFDVELLDFK